MGRFRAVTPGEQQVDIGKTVTHGVEGGALEIQVERGEHVNAPGLRGQAGEGLRHLPADHVHEIWRPVVHGAGDHVQRFTGGAVGGLGGDVVLLHHRAQHRVAAFDRPLWIGEGRVRGWALDDARDQGRLAQAQVGDVFAEKQSCRLADAVDCERAALPEIDVVQIELENRILRGAPLQDQRHERLA